MRDYAEDELDTELRALGAEFNASTSVFLEKNLLISVMFERSTFER